MNKNEAVNLLKKKGYSAENDRGVVIVITDGENCKSKYIEIERLLRDNGYNSSFGIKPGIVGNKNSVQAEVFDDFDSDINGSDNVNEDDKLSFGYTEDGNGQLSFI